MLKNILALQKYRFGDNLEIEIDDKLKQMQVNVIPVSIQILIENAIKHNSINEKEKLKIRIYSCQKIMFALKIFKY